ncbi:hypothetical protein Nepgr_012219 [Nepenthes gracilis]|uniref:Uncharacterized protein n=1 Tax=Nepenthes gracilis TaxID=150966 RepID=A0AAD3XMV3_NEPGR|nr:hypothetical protein Nepgr_012219 [Nepenthes gracilis]
MPLTNTAVDALGILTICLVFLLVLLGLFCIIHTLYFCSRVQRSGFVALGYFNGPWIVRIIFILFGIWWGFGEIVRLRLLRQKGRIFDSLGLKWQEDICKYYILSNLGFSEPCLFLTMSFLLQASLQWRGSGIFNHKWNLKTTCFVLLYCLPVFVLDLIFVLIGPKFDKGKNKLLQLPQIFTSTTRLSNSQPYIAICTYPLLCTILYGLFAVVLTSYLLFLGRRMVSSVINNRLQSRVYILIVTASSCLPSRVILLGFSAMARAQFLFEALVFFGFLVLLLCVVVGIFVLVYLPAADSLTLHRGLQGNEARRSRVDRHRSSFSSVRPSTICFPASTGNADT